MYKSEEDKRAYFKERYKTHKDRYVKASNNYWYNYACKRLGKIEVSDEEIRQCKNAYYREYRAAHPVETKQTQARFYQNWAERNKESEE